MATITSQNPTNPQIETNRQRLFRLFKERPMPDEELLVNLGLYMRSGALAKVLMLYEIYQKIVHIPGHILEFGVWYGQTLTVLENLRAVLEPYNRQRHIVGFDTFTGYPNISSRDKASDIIKKNVYSVPDNYQAYLNELLQFHEKENVMSHVKKHQTVKGDVRDTFPQWLADHPEAFVALAYFDMALYEPTKHVLQQIKDRLIPGSILVFDELNHREYPGETLAVKEELNPNDFTIELSTIMPDRTWYIKK